MARTRMWLLLLLALGCAQSEVVHGLDERQANEVLVALDAGGVAAEKRRDDGAEERWTVAVPGASASQARRILAEEELPRPRPPGFGEVFGKGSMVPTPTEERALYLHALAGELSRSVEAIDGVVAARVHLAIPPVDVLRPGPTAPPRGAVLVKVRPGTRSRVEPLAPGVQSLVAGAVPGLEPAAVSVVLAEADAVARPREQGASRSRPLLVVAAALAAVAAAVLLARPLRAQLARRRSLTR